VAFILSPVKWFKPTILQKPPNNTRGIDDCATWIKVGCPLLLATLTILQLTGGFFRWHIYLEAMAAV
jgi:hypothetical protein